MVTRISESMISTSAVPVMMAELGIGEVEIGDFTWSARGAKAGWLKCEGQAVSRTNYWQGTGPASGSSTQNNTGGGGGHNNMQPFLAANLCIFAGV